MIKRFTFFGGMVLVALTVNAQSYKEGYVQWGEFGQQFGTTVSNWTPGQQINEDDNFFISRVKPKVRFRNAATQVRSTINETNDKRLVMWVPVDDVSENALPNGVYDSEVFSMWSYVTHYGNWTAPQGRMPGNFADVAHKNGVDGALSGIGETIGAVARELGMTVVVGEKMIPPLANLFIDNVHPNDVGFAFYAHNLIRELSKK